MKAKPGKAKPGKAEPGVKFIMTTVIGGLVFLVPLKLRA